MTATQFAKLCGAAALPFRALLDGLWLTGARPGELAALTAADVDLASGVALLTRHKTVEKTGRPRAVFLSPAALKLFASQVTAHPAGPIFPRSDGGAWTVHNIGTTMRRVRKTAGIPTATAYGFRHSFATTALACGVPRTRRSRSGPRCSVTPLRRCERVTRPAAPDGETVPGPCRNMNCNANCSDSVAASECLCSGENIHVSTRYLDNYVCDITFRLCHLYRRR